MLNMSAGQTMMSASCLRQMAAQMETPIYYPWYWDLEQEVRAMLRTVLGTEGDVLLLAGSATFGIEAGIRSTIRPGGKVVVINGGVFGQVLVDIVRAVGCVPVEVPVPYGTAPDMDRVARALDQQGVEALAAVHAETSTGTAFPIDRLGALAREKGVLFLVDAVSSVGGMEFHMDAWGVDLCFTSPQKCLSGPQGIAIVAVSERAWQAVRRRERPVDSICLDLEVWKRYHDEKVDAMNRAWRQGAREPRPHGRAAHEPSPSGPLVRGLHGALLDLLKEGLPSVLGRHRVCARAVREAVRAVGLRTVAAEEVAAPVVTVFYLPEGVYEKDFRAAMLSRWGIAIGNGEIGDDNVRVGTMGTAAQPQYVLATVTALEDTLRRFGHRFSAGAGVQAALDVLAAEGSVRWHGSAV